MSSEYVYDILSIIHIKFLLLSQYYPLINPWLSPNNGISCCCLYYHPILFPFCSRYVHTMRIVIIINWCNGHTNGIYLYTDYPGILVIPLYSHSHFMPSVFHTILPWGSSSTAVWNCALLAEKHQETDAIAPARQRQGGHGVLPAKKDGFWWENQEKTWVFDGFMVWEKVFTIDIFWVVQSVYGLETIKQREKNTVPCVGLSKLSKHACGSVYFWVYRGTLFWPSEARPDGAEDDVEPQTDREKSPHPDLYWKSN